MCVVDCSSVMWQRSFFLLKPLEREPRSPGGAWTLFRCPVMLLFAHTSKVLISLLTNLLLQRTICLSVPFESQVPILWPPPSIPLWCYSLNTGSPTQWANTGILWMLGKHQSVSLYYCAGKLVSYLFLVRYINDFHWQWVLFGGPFWNK